MKQYTGTKTIKAMPITMGEAYERKLLKKGVKPSECETYKAGYLVEYDDGYQSWCPAETFEKDYKPSETALDCLRIEYSVLRERFIKLERFLSVGFDETAKMVGGKHAALLITQSVFMEKYLEVLASRIADLGGELNK